MRRVKMILSAVVLGVLTLYLLYDKLEGEGLRTELEGAYLDLNYRDVGASLNACLADRGLTPIYREEVFTRANKWFSGWSCDLIGRPAAIFSLNYRPERRHVYFCRNDDGSLVVGQHANQSYELNDLEFVETWKKPHVRRDVCQTVYGILSEIAVDEKVLIHCDAGRDRTGAMAALIAAALTPSGLLAPGALQQALDCDYRRSKSLATDKYGRIRSFIGELDQNFGGAARFLEETCGFDQSLIADARRGFLRTP